MSDAPDKPDYRSTVFLPRTDFPMKAGLPQKEPLILAKWQEGDLYGQVRAHRAGREKFILHDGPPYANGDIHIGHTLNKVLKDMVVRTQTLLGKDVPYIPGWDCHGLPIEWKIEEQYRKKKRNKDEVPVKEFRAECRAYAQHWVTVQTEQFQRLGITGQWDRPYLTMSSEAEGTIVAELMKFAESGQLYRGAKPVMWSPVEKTALAEAEIEYEDITSTQIDVAFEIVESPISELVGAYAVVWTTTPWTIPVNQAIAYGPEVEYLPITVWGEGFQNAEADPFDVSLHPLFPVLRGRKFLIAKELLGEFSNRLTRSFWAASAEVFGDDQKAKPIIHYPFEGLQGSKLVGTVARHPMHHIGGFFAKPRPFLPGDFVTTDSGTGLVHMSPDHGEDDFELCKAHGIDPVFAVEADGRYREDWPWLGGADERRMSVINPKFNAPEGPICSDLREAGALLAASYDYQHSYPHSWRSKAKVIYRCTPQWFVAMDKVLGVHHPKTRAEMRWENEGGAPLAPPPPSAVPLPTPSAQGGAEVAGSSSLSRSDGEGDRSAQPSGGGATLRQLALQAIAETRFVPEKGRNRIGSMVEGRPDWVLSRQRAWGVPIAVFVERKSGRLLVDHEVNQRIVAAIKAEGVDAWDDERACFYLNGLEDDDQDIVVAARKKLHGQWRDPADYERVTDILDVWFDSGCTHVFTLESGHWPEQRWPADLYLEGSDQHRGWFQSSLLQSCGTRGRAPYDQVLTHGFTMDSKGMKMSKSLGNTISPLDLMRDYGADILRLWALSVDFTEDHRIGKEILAGVGDQYRKLRNTFRYLLGALDGFGEEERLPVANMPELERYMLALTAELDARLRKAVYEYDFNDYVRALTDFCNEDLSAFFFDIRKDSLYCDAPGDPKRRAYRTVLDVLFHALVRWAAPVLVFTAEEVWGTRYPDAESVHLLEWPLIDTEWREDRNLIVKWNELRQLREKVTEAIEPLRRDKFIGSSLEAEVTVTDIGAILGDYRDPALLAELFIVSSVKLGDELSVAKTDKHKCGRCWRLLPEVGSDGDLCKRCEEVVNA